MLAVVARASQLAVGAGASNPAVAGQASHPAVAVLFALGAAGLAAVVVAMAWSVHARQIRLAELLVRRQFLVIADAGGPGRVLDEGAQGALGALGGGAEEAGELEGAGRARPGQAYESMGIAQVRWRPNGSVDAGTEPLRWESTAFNIDYQASVVRFYYDNPDGARSSWGDSTYQPCQQWNSIGGWNSPYPWGNAEQETYISNVQTSLSQTIWTTSSFLDWTPSSFPPGIKFL